MTPLLRRWMVPLAGLLGLGAAWPAGAAILEAGFVSGREWRLAEMGTLDWVVYRAEAGEARAGQAKGGDALIDRRLHLSAGATAAPGRFSAGEFDWPAGPAGDDGTGNQAEAPPTVALTLTATASATVNFTGGRAGHPRVVGVGLRAQGRINATVVQGGVQRTVTASGSGWIRVLHDGAEPLAITLAGAEPGPWVITGVTALVAEPGVWWVRDGRFVFAYAPVPQEQLLQRSRAKGTPDFGRLARDFADAMLRHGRDRYGPRPSPLFLRGLTREPEPALLPHPLHAALSPAQERVQSLSERSRRPPDSPANPYHRFNYNRILNHPKGLGPAGPHKVTVYGADPAEDRDLYALLFRLGEGTGDDRYPAAAREALTWWYAHTQRAGGLYPWGEHAGWDPVHECPTYFAGPLQGFFEANYHEMRDFLLHVELLAALPAARPGEPTPLDRYALGVWRHHFWDKERAIYNRHADIDGIISQQGEWMGFPAHLGYYLRLWAAALLATRHEPSRQEITTALTRVAEMALRRTEKYGFFPFTFEPELFGRDPGREVPTQSLRLAHHAFAVAEQLAAVAPEISGRLTRFARLHLPGQPDDVTRRLLRLARESGDVSFLAGRTMPAPGQVLALRDFSGDVLSEPLAQEILNCVWFHRETGRPEYRAAAEAYARIAHELFCDDRSPLPRAFRFEAPVRTATGGPFPDFYFGGARLMRAFAELGGAGR